MAGKFLTLEETARQLGVTVDEVQRLVDRKKLFPMRDGATIKFKVDDVERLMQDLGDEVPQTEELSLDLEPAASAPAADSLSGIEADDIVLGDAIDAGDSLFADGGDGAAAPNTVVRGGGGGSVAAGDASGLSLPSLSGTSGADIVFGDGTDGNDDLALESVIGASSIGTSAPSLSGQSAITGGPGEIDQTLAIDLGGDGGAAADEGTVLGGDDFELGGGGGDDESASVVIAESEAGESSFFGQAMAGEGSAFGDESAGLPSSIASEAMAMPGDYSPEMGFSGLQLAGLICCSLLLLFGGFIAYDLVRTIGSPESTTLANPLLDAMASTFGWR